MADYSLNSQGKYDDLIYTNYPAEIDSWEDNIDVNADTVSLANQYKQLLETGRYTEAKALYDANPSTLGKMRINANDINEVKHAVMALERYYKETFEQYLANSKQIVTQATEPTGQKLGDIWQKVLSNVQGVIKAIQYRFNGTSYDKEYIQTSYDMVDGLDDRVKEVSKTVKVDSAGEATKLETPRNINGVAFDGTGDITVADNTKLPLTGGTLSGGLTVNGYMIADSNSNRHDSQYILRRGSNNIVLGITQDGSGYVLSSSINHPVLEIPADGPVQLNGNATTATAALSANLDADGNGLTINLASNVVGADAATTSTNATSSLSKYGRIVTLTCSITFIGVSSNSIWTIGVIDQEIHRPIIGVHAIATALGSSGVYVTMFIDTDGSIKVYPREDGTTIKNNKTYSFTVTYMSKV